MLLDLEILTGVKIDHLTVVLYVDKVPLYFHLHVFGSFFAGRPPEGPSAVQAHVLRAGAAAQRRGRLLPRRAQHALVQIGRHQVRNCKDLESQYKYFLICSVISS